MSDKRGGGPARFFVDWNDANVAIMLKGFHEGLSASQIAALIPNATKNSVIGRWHRMGMRKGENPVKRGPREISVLSILVERKAVRPNETERAMPKSADRVSEVAYDTVRAETAFKSALPTAFGRDDIATMRANALAARPVSAIAGVASARLTGQCQWPSGDPLRPGYSVCGAPAYDRAAYCEKCKKLAYEPRKPNMSVARLRRR